MRICREQLGHADGRAEPDSRDPCAAVSPSVPHVPVADDFPDDLTGHFWAALSRVDDVNARGTTVYDYQDNVMLAGVASTEQQAARIVRASDSSVILSDFEGNDDPSLPF